MLAKKYRVAVQSLKNKKPAKQIRSRYFFLKYFENKLSFSRFGVVVPKGVSALANKRNWMKRQAFDFFETVEKELAQGDYLLGFSGSARELIEAKDDIVKQLRNLISEL